MSGKRVNMRLIHANHGSFPERGRELLSLAVYNANEDRLNEILSKRYAIPDAKLFILHVGEEICGIIGILKTSRTVAEILHLAVAPQHQGKEYGRMMVKMIVDGEGIQTLMTETDGDAVGFYSRCGFTIQTLGEKYPGTERFRCCLVLG